MCIPMKNKLVTGNSRTGIWPNVNRISKIDRESFFIGKSKIIVSITWQLYLCKYVYLLMFE